MIHLMAISGPEVKDMEDQVPLYQIFCMKMVLKEVKHPQKGKLRKLSSDMEERIQTYLEKRCEI